MAPSSRQAVKRGRRLVRAVAAPLALALLALLVQQHRHAGTVESQTCVACVVHAQRATPVDAQPRLAAPLLVALKAVPERDQKPRSLAVPTPRAQGPPAA
jgi:hypothetical protein